MADLPRQPSVLFPPTRAGVLLPRHDRAAAATGVTLYTASRPAVLAGQWLAWGWVRVLGSRLLPGPRRELSLPSWDELADSWRPVLGAVDAVAAYSRRDDRPGATMALFREGRAIALVKVREQATGLLREQRLLGALLDLPGLPVAVPAPLGSGTTTSGLSWSAQAFVFDRPHRPVHAVSASDLEALAGSLAAAFDACGWRSQTSGSVPSHRDLTPWNLRADHRRRTWLIDWEDADFAPAGADAAYLELSAAALRGRTHIEIDGVSASYWRAILEERIRVGHLQPINHRMLALLSQRPNAT